MLKVLIEKKNTQKKNQQVYVRQVCTRLMDALLRQHAKETLLFHIQPLHYFTLPSYTKHA